MKLLFSAVYALSTLVLASACGANDTVDGGYSPGYDAGHGEDVTVATSSGTGTGSSSSTATTTVTVTATGATTGSETTTGTSSSASAGGAPVINEINGKGSDYVELVNPTTAAIDIGGWGITDAKREDGGMPGSPKTPVLFVAGTVLAPGGYALAFGATQDGGTPLTCPVGVTCVQAAWNVSDSSGATVYLHDASGATVEMETFPGSSSSGQSWGRIPNGTGAFAVNTQTPGAANEAP